VNPEETTFNPDKHHRHSIRLRDYDYAQAGMYFVTVCAAQRECVFGDVVDGQMRLNEAGQMVQQVWECLSIRFSSVALDAFVVMPNHIHGIVAIVGAEGAASSAPTLGKIMRAFKSISAIESNRLLSRSGQPLWQRNYYEHVIRNEGDMAHICQYILDNPSKWLEDAENPQNLQGRCLPRPCFLE
jgi:REP element-mobilizing transposase RayT